MAKLRISVVIPAYNEEDAIEHTIKKIKEVMKENGCEYEIIVINDGSTDNSLKILEKIKDIRLINNV
ncbi:MAG: glycosyltransferase, partial [Nanoarchaeota archaeon]